MVKGLVRGCGALIAAVAVGVLAFPQPSPNAYDRPGATLLALAVFAIVAAWPLAARRANTVGPLLGRIVGSPLWIPVWTVAASVSGYLALYPPQSWDASNVALLATSAPDAWDQGLRDYALRYPNNLGIVAVAKAVSWAFPQNYELGFLALNAGSFALAAWGVRDVVTRASKAWAGVAVSVLGVLVGLSPWLAVAYVDVIAMWTPIVTVALALRAWDAAGTAGSVLLWIASGLACAAGVVLRTTPLLVAAAVAMWLLVALARRGVRMRAMSAMVCFGVALAMGTVVSRGVLSAASGYPDRQEVAVTGLVNVAMGMSYRPATRGTGAYGVYEANLDRVTTNQSTAIQNSIAAAYIEDRLDELGPVGVVDFLVRKVLFTWGDGSFLAYGEGFDVESHPYSGSGVWQSIVAADGSLRPAWTTVLDGLWFGVLLVVGWGLLRGPVRRDVLLPALVVVALLIFLAGFQTRSRYVLTFAPAVIAVAGVVAAGRPALPEGPQDSDEISPRPEAEG